MTGRVNANADGYLVCWQCDKCECRISGFLQPGDSIERHCGSNYAHGKSHYPLRTKKAGLIVPYECKGKMVVMLDDRPEKV
jgi:hypothetical protein